MKTIPLYYEDVHRKTFEAVVLSCEESDKGFSVVLDQTIFYPEGGGQPCDLGILGDAKVLDVREKEGVVFHLCDSPLMVGEAVQGTIDWDRRLSHMQSHSGEHIFSGLICSKFGYSNVGFHMGSDFITIDFDGEISMDALLEIEEEANRLVWANVPVDCRYPSPEELPTIPYRSKKVLEYPVRIVTIPGGDCCACCGTHVKHTGEIGLIKVLSCIKFKQGVRIQLACGQQAYTLMQQVFEQNRRVSQAFSAKILETGAAAVKMNEALEQEKFTHRGTKDKLFSVMAKAGAGRDKVILYSPDLHPGDIRILADKLADYAGVAAVLAPKETGLALCLISRGEDVRPLGKQAAAALSGSGGGKNAMYQGSLGCKPEEALAFFVEIINFEVLNG